MCVVKQLPDAMNAHGPQAMLDSYPRGPSSEQPVHPGRGFAGREQVRANWSTIFDAVPIFAADLVNVSRDDHQVVGLALVRDASGRQPSGRGRCDRRRRP